MRLFLRCARWCFDVQGTSPHALCFVGRRSRAVFKTGSVGPFCPANVATCHLRFNAILCVYYLRRRGRLTCAVRFEHAWTPRPANAVVRRSRFDAILRVYFLRRCGRPTHTVRLCLLGRLAVRMRRFAICVPARYCACISCDGMAADPYGSAGPGLDALPCRCGGSSFAFQCDIAHYIPCGWQSPLARLGWARLDALPCVVRRRGAICIPAHGGAMFLRILSRGRTLAARGGTIYPYQHQRRPSAWFTEIFRT